MDGGVAHAHTLGTNTRARRHARTHTLCETHRDPECGKVANQGRANSLVPLTCAAHGLSLLTTTFSPKWGGGYDTYVRTCLSVYVCGWLRVSFPHSILVGLFSVSSLMSCVTTSSRPFSGLRLGGSPAHWDALRVFPLALARTNARTHLNMQSPHQEDDVILGTRIFLLTYSSALHCVIFPAEIHFGLCGVSSSKNRMPENVFQKLQNQLFFFFFSSGGDSNR